MIKQAEKAWDAVEKTIANFREVALELKRIEKAMKIFEAKLGGAATVDSVLMSQAGDLREALSQVVYNIEYRS